MARVQQPAPHWAGTAVIDNDFEEISLDQYKGRYLVFFFYPNDFTFVCPTEIIGFSERLEEFRKIKCDIVACSCDSHYCHLAWTNMSRSEGGVGRVRIPLLSDITKQIAKSYGVLLEDQGIALRALFIIDGNGIVRSSMVNDIPVGRSVDEVLRLVKAFQFTDIHGEVCPEGWSHGESSLSLTDSSSYFETQFKKH